MTEAIQEETTKQDEEAAKQEKPEIKPITHPPEPDYDFLDPARLRLFTDKSGRLRATVEEDRSFLDVNVVRVFPQSIPSGYWALTGPDGRVIGVIAEPEKLEKSSLEAARQALQRHYFLPVITEICSLKEEFGAVYFEVETDRGPRSFVAKGVRDGIVETETGELILVDVDENRYRIPDWHRLSARSRRHLERII